MKSWARLPRRTQTCWCLARMDDQDSSDCSWGPSVKRWIGGARWDPPASDTSLSAITFSHPGCWNSDRPRVPSTSRSACVAGDLVPPLCANPPS